MFPCQLRTPLEIHQQKDFSNTCAVEKIFGTTYGELPAVPKSLVGENKDDTKHEVRRVHTPIQNIFLGAHSAMQNVEILLFAEAVTGSREWMGAA